MTNVLAHLTDHTQPLDQHLCPVFSARRLGLINPDKPSPFQNTGRPPRRLAALSFTVYFGIRKDLTKTTSLVLTQLRTKRKHTMPVWTGQPDTLPCGHRVSSTCPLLIDLRSNTYVGGNLRKLGQLNMLRWRVHKTTKGIDPGHLSR